MTSTYYLADSASVSSSLDPLSLRQHAGKLSPTLGRTLLGIDPYSIQDTTSMVALAWHNRTRAVYVSAGFRALDSPPRTQPEYSSFKGKEARRSTFVLWQDKVIRTLASENEGCPE